MIETRLAGATALLIAIVANACSAQRVDDAMVVSSDPTLVALASRLLPDLARRSTLDLREPVRIERRSRGQLVGYLQAKLDEEMPQADADAIVAVYSLLGLVPADLDLRSVLLSLYEEQVAGYYEPDSTALFVMDDQSDASLEPLLVHELVHALQDQSVDLNALIDREMGNDRAIAAQAAIEGHATLVMLEYGMEQMVGAEIDLADIPDFATRMRPMLNATRGQFPALAGAPSLLQEEILFPYVEGTGFVQSLWARGERVSPFGERLPVSTEQVLSGGAAPPPVELQLAVSAGDVLKEDVLGRLEIGVLLREHGADEHAADGWDGDRYALVEAGNGRGLSWYAVWESEGARARFADEMQGILGRLGGPATLESIDLDGRAATLLRVGGPGPVGAHIRSEDET